MRISERIAVLILPVAFLLGTPVGPALALDEEKVVQRERSPWDVFRLGFSAYKRGEKEKAVEAYRYAAENGQVGARWKLGRMYAEGDGVPRNDFEAFKFFIAVAQQNVRPGSQEESYVSDALVAIADYLRTGIPDAPVDANPAAARDYYLRAAAAYRNATAQFELGRMFLEGEGGAKNVQQAARWLQLAAEKGHAGAQATLGNLLFHNGKRVRGLALMTSALQRAAPADIPWIRKMQEEAFALVGESDRRTAIALSENYLANGIE